MCEIMNYIFGSLNNSETAIRLIQKSMNKQARYNRKLSMFALVAMVNMELERVEQKKRIEKLEITIEEMKRDKGE